MSARPEKKRRAETDVSTLPSFEAITVAPALSSVFRFLDLFSWTRFSCMNKGLRKFALRHRTPSVESLRQQIKSGTSKQSSTLSLRLQVFGCLYGLGIEPRCNWPKARLLLDAAEATGSEWTAEIFFLRYVYVGQIINGSRDLGNVIFREALGLLKRSADQGHGLATEMVDSPRILDPDGKLTDHGQHLLRDVLPKAMAQGEIFLAGIASVILRRDPTWAAGMRFMNRVRAAKHAVYLATADEKRAIGYPGQQLADFAYSGASDAKAAEYLIDEIGIPHASYLLSTRSGFKATDPARYRACLQKAAEAGHWFACFELSAALLADDAIDKKTACSWAVKAADSGCKHCAVLLCGRHAAAGLTAEQGAAHCKTHGIDWMTDEGMFAVSGRAPLSFTSAVVWPTIGRLQAAGVPTPPLLQMDVLADALLHPD